MPYCFLRYHPVAGDRELHVNIFARNEEIEAAFRHCIFALVRISTCVPSQVFLVFFQLSGRAATGADSVNDVVAHRTKPHGCCGTTTKKPLYLALKSRQIIVSWMTQNDQAGSWRSHASAYTRFTWIARKIS